MSRRRRNAYSSYYGSRGGSRGPADWLWADGARRQRLAIPSAFDQFTRALPAEGD